MIRVFISYSHDSSEHKKWVFDLATKLRREGITCEIDQYHTSPPEGWPTWMRIQIENAEFVLIVCTETYKNKFESRESSGGYGVAWESMLTEVDLYDKKGLNEKYLPVICTESDASHIPKILKAYTRYNLSNEQGYEDLYRKLTKQPSVVAVPIGEIRLLSPIPEAEFKSNSTIRIIASGPAIIWRLPRGFILVEGLINLSPERRGPLATYFDYRGKDIGATHYDVSYSSWDTRKGLETQCGKLGVQSADWEYAKRALLFMKRIGDSEVNIDAKGTLISENVSEIDGLLANIHVGEEIDLPECPSIYSTLSFYGELRDELVRISELLETWNEYDFRSKIDIETETDSLRRRGRILISKFVAKDGPLNKNFEEIAAKLDSCRERKRTRKWIQDVQSTLAEVLAELV